MTSEDRIAELEARIVELENVQGILVRSLNMLIRKVSTMQPPLSPTQNSYDLDAAWRNKKLTDWPI